MKILLTYATHAAADNAFAAYMLSAEYNFLETGDSKIREIRRRNRTVTVIYDV